MHNLTINSKLKIWFRPFYAMWPGNELGLYSTAPRTCMGLRPHGSIYNRNADNTVRTQ